MTITAYSGGITAAAVFPRRWSSCCRRRRRSRDHRHPHEPHQRRRVVLEPREVEAHPARVWAARGVSVRRRSGHGAAAAAAALGGPSHLFAEVVAHVIERLLKQADVGKRRRFVPPRLHGHTRRPLMSAHSVYSSSRSVECSGKKVVNTRCETRVGVELGALHLGRQRRSAAASMIEKTRRCARAPRRGAPCAPSPAPAQPAEAEMHAAGFRANIRRLAR